MKTIKVAEASGLALDWLVAKCEGDDVKVLKVDGETQIWWSRDVFDNFKGQQCYTDRDGKPRFFCEGRPVGLWGSNRESYPEDWCQAGPIIEREKIGFWWATHFVDAEGNEYGNHWYAEPAMTDENKDKTYQCQTGATPLVAAMRCYVASKLGDTAEIPEELA